MASRDYQPHSREGTSPTHTHDTHIDSEEKLRYELAKTVTLTPELYEKLFISPKTQVASSLRTTFGNPTPIGVLGFSVSVLPLACAFSELLHPRSHLSPIHVANLSSSGMARLGRSFRRNYRSYHLVWQHATHPRWHRRVSAQQQLPHNRVPCLRCASLIFRYDIHPVV